MTIQDINLESQAIWDENAAEWDRRSGEDGLPMQRTLIAPATERLLDVQPGWRVLDIACGNGAFARRLASLGAKVIASDFSAVFLKKARARSIAYSDRIEYRLADATDEAALLALGEAASFDAAVCTMGLMDMSAIEPLFRALATLLRPGGAFVFSVMHPCFNGDSTLVAEDYYGQETLSVKVHRYLTPITTKGKGIASQPTQHHYFFRPLSVLFKAGFDAGFALDGLEEPAFPPMDEQGLTWERFSDIPPVIVARMRITSGAWRYTSGYEAHLVRTHCCLAWAWVTRALACLQ
jgi:2-polyprenyl-3-methyl-5-hydroxy-6-metoxy-1,4-benzoquinol methylase